MILEHIPKKSSYRRAIALLEASESIVWFTLSNLQRYPAYFTPVFVMRR
jgi:hypothetical protein